MSSLPPELNRGDERLDGSREDDQLSLIFGALADPTRWAILARLSEGEAAVAGRAEPFDVSLQAIFKHLIWVDEP